MGDKSKEKSVFWWENDEQYKRLTREKKSSCEESKRLTCEERLTCEDVAGIFGVICGILGGLLIILLIKN